MNLIQLAEQFEEKSLQGRYIALQHIQPLLEQESYKAGISIIGSSVENRPIYSYKIGTGKIRILMWSQMHGNESTTTKALFDLFNFLHSSNNLAYLFNEWYSFCFLPMLNPDGAAAYTRENANAIDLNRDAQNLSQPESKVLRSIYLTFKPDYCFNLHDQRSIYGVGNSGKSAVLSFLAPSFNENREINETRGKALNVIAAIHATLSKYIPDEIGRFDDTFNLNCVGDTFQFLETPTILFEAGHFAEDYDRNYTRKLIFTSFLSALNFISENDVVIKDINEYLLIPQNKVNFYDLFYINVVIFDGGIKKMINFAVHYEETLIDHKIQFLGYIVAINDLENFFGHVVIDCQNKIYSGSLNNNPKVGEIANFSLNNIKIFVDGKKIV